MNDSTQSGGLIQRAQNIIMRPAQTWPVIAAEPSSPGELITRYAVPLAAIGPVAMFLRGQVFGYGALGISFRPGLVSGISSMIVSYVLALVGVIVLALIADFLAPKFDGVANRTNAFKLVVYSCFAAWLSQIFQLIPGLGLLGLAGLYSGYLYYTGATPLMKVPQDKSVAYSVVTLVCAVVLWLVVGTVTASLVGLFGLAGGPSIAANDSSATVTLPGGTVIDTSKIDVATKQMQAVGNGQVKPIDGAQLQSLLPESLNGFSRTALESNAMGQMGTEAEATYTLGDKSFRLKVLDSTGLGAIAGIGSAMGVAHSREDADGYERSTSVNGQMQIEKWNNKDHRGEFTQQVASRFMITAEGEAESIDQLKSAVAAIDQGKLASMAK
ncbi:MAG: Yip1 family protein [Novosphingobium sp.]